MKAPRLFSIVMLLLCAGCNLSQAPRTFMGIATNRADWPYRYRITQTDGQWSGTVELRVPTGWVPWDTMHITEQEADRLSFKALLGEPGKAIPLGWYLDLGDTSRQSFSGRLTGDAFDSSAVDLQFTPWNGEH